MTTSGVPLIDRNAIEMLTAARRHGVLTPNQMERILDGTVSKRDLQEAQKAYQKCVMDDATVRAHYQGRATPEAFLTLFRLGSSQDVLEFVSARLDQQSALRTMLEGVKDSFKS